MFAVVYHKHYPDWGCMLPIRDSSPAGMSEVNLIYTYFIMKVVDLFDTVFFVLRKRYNQVTYLHVYHHISICFISYLTTAYIPGGHSAPFGILNSLVHCAMYFYYLMTVINSEIKKSTTWKKRITQLQLLQFLAITVHFLRPILFRKDCKYPKFILILQLIQVMFMTALFSDFYIKTYFRRPKSKSRSIHVEEEKKSYHQR